MLPPVDTLPKPVLIERRARVRFPLDLGVRFQTLGREPFAGVGWVVDISSRGVLVACQEKIKAGTRVELHIEWPSLLDGRIPLQIFAAGTVVRCERARFAVELSRYHFRTTSRMGIRIVKAASA